MRERRERFGEVHAPTSSEPSRSVRGLRARVASCSGLVKGRDDDCPHHPPEVVLGVVQGFMTFVTEVASAHAGTVKDFEGDGALLYFGSMKNAVRTALAIRRRLADGRCDIACGTDPGSPPA